MNSQFTRIVIGVLALALLLLVASSVSGLPATLDGTVTGAIDQSSALSASIDQASGPRFWDVPPHSGVVAFVNDRHMVVPGPDDEVRLIVQLADDPLAVYIHSFPPSKLLSADEVAAVRSYADRLAAAHRQVLAQIDQRGIEVKVNREFSHLVNAIAISAKMRDWPRLKELPQVKAVQPDYEVQADLSESVPLIGAPLVWVMTDGSGHTVDGQGMRVAIVDTGIDYTHPDLGGCFGSNCKVVDGFDFINNDSNPMDDNGHGTHVAGIVAANGVLKGVAPGAKLLAYKVLSAGGSGPMSTVIAGLERAADPDGNPATTDDDADVINMSLGGHGNPDDLLSQAVDNVVDQGIVVVVSAGNGGPGYETLGSPAAARKALTVAASDKSDLLAGFSSRGPIRDYSGLLKPDITAPGVSIRSTVPVNGENGSPDRYRYLDGTSMAAPHIAGAAALIKQLHPTWTPALIKANLMNTAKDLGKGVYEQGAGRVQVAVAANVPFVATPGSFGFDQLFTGIVTSTQLTVVNVGATPLTVTASVSTVLWDNGGLSGSMTPVPVDYVQLAESDLSIPAGGAKVITVTLNVPLDAAGGYYTGQVILRSVHDTVRVPFAFTLLSEVTVHILDENGVEWLDPWSYGVQLIRVSDLAVQQNNWGMNQIPPTFQLPPGTYHVYGTARIYWYAPLLEGLGTSPWKPMILAATVTITDNSNLDVYLDARTARHFTLDATTFAGDPLFMHQMNAGYLYRNGEQTYKAMLGFSYADDASTDLRAPLPATLDLFISDTPVSTTFEIGVAGFGFSPPLQHFNDLNTAKWYAYTDPHIRSGLAYRQWADEVHLFAWQFPTIDAATPTTLAYARNEVGRYHMKYDLPGILSYSPSYDGGFFSGIDALVYVPYGPTTGAAQAIAGIERDVFYHGLFHYQLWPDGGNYQFSTRAFYDGNAQPLPPADESFQLGGGPLYPMVLFDNTASAIRYTRPVLGSPGRNGAIWCGYSLWLNVYRDDAPVYAGWVEEAAMPSTDWIISSLGPGQYRWVIPLTCTSTPYDDRLEAGFTLTTTTADMNPPHIVAFDMPQRFASYQTITATLTITDAESGVNNVQLHYSLDDGLSWTQAPVTNVGAQYRAAIPISDVLAITLNYTATDNAGNYLAFTMHRAALHETPAYLAMNVAPLSVQREPRPMTLTLSGTLRTSNDQPLANVGLPIKIYVNDRLAGYVRDITRRPDGKTAYGTIQFDWAFIPTDLITTAGTVPLKFVFDVGTYAYQEQTFDLNVVELNHVYLPLVLNNFTALHADFTASPDRGIVPLKVAFTNRTVGTYTSIRWDFGDGVTSTLSNPSHTYAVTGTFTATLTVSSKVEASRATATILVQDRQELLVNGGFETDEAWQFNGAPELGGYTTTVAHTGQRSVKLGILPPAPLEYGYAIVSQIVEIPSSATSARLSFWYWPRREDGGGSTTHSRQFVNMLDDGGNLLENLIDSSDDLPDWQYAEFDVSKYAGRTIIVQFGVYHDGNVVWGKRTAMFIDDVSLAVAAPGFRSGAGY